MPALREQLWQDVAQIAALPGLNLRGLMTMAPIVEDMEQARPVFAGLAALRDALAEFVGAAAARSEHGHDRRLSGGD